MADGITRIAVEGFKSIAKRQEIEIRPLTILAGANSSGKSAIMQPLLMLKQTLEAPYDPGPLRIDGDNVRFSSTDQFFSKTDVSTRCSSLRVEIDAPQRRYAVTFALKGPLEFGLRQETTVRDKMRTMWPEMTGRDIEDAFAGEQLPSGVRVIRERFFVNLAIADLRITTQWVEPFVLGVLHVPSLRGIESRTYAVRAVGPIFPGAFDEYAGSLIHLWQRQNSQTYESLLRDIRHTGLAQSVFAHRIDDVRLEIRVPRLPADHPYDMVNISDVGFGVSQVLPVLVALRAAEEGQLVYLEEPETHLHPRAQTKLADILAGAAKRGVRVVAETHSALLLTAIQTLVAKGELSPDLVKLHWFGRDPETGITQVNSADLDENGAFGEWPEDFGAVALDTEGGYLDAVEGRLGR